MSTVALRLDLTQAYTELQPRLKGIAARYASKCRGSWLYEDILSEVHDLFMDAAEKYEAGRGPFDRWAVYRINMGLLECLRTRIRRQRQIPRVDLVLDTVAEREFDLNILFAEVSQDAQDVLRIVLDAPTDVKLGMLERRSTKPNSLKASVLEYLTDIGWSADRIAESFGEISEAIAS